MRYSIMFLFIGMFITLPAMEKPPQLPEKKVEAAAKEAATYLSLLPADVRNIVFNFLTNVQGDTDFDRLDNAIASLRNFMEADPQLKEKLLNDAAFNEQLIKMLSERFGIHQSEVALMLNTPASLNFLTHLTAWVPEKYGSGLQEIRWRQILQRDFHDSLDHMAGETSEQRAQDAIRYAKRFLIHPFVQQKNAISIDEEEFDSIRYKTIPIHIDSIAHGFPKSRTRYDGKEDGGNLSRNAKVTQDYIDIAVKLNDPISLAWVKDIFKYAGDILLRKFFKALQRAIKEHNKAAIDFILQVLLSIPEKVKRHFNKQFIEQHDSYDNPRQANFEDFLKDIFVYLEETQDYQVLEILSSLIDDQIIKRIDTSMLTRAPFNERANEPFIKKLITLGADINGKDDNGSTVLINAVVQGKSDLVRILLQIPGINIDLCDSYGNNALWYAQNASMNLAVRQEIIELLKGAGAQEREVCTGL